MLTKFNFDDVIKRLQKVKTDLPVVLANTTKNYFMRENFDKQQFDGTAWKDVLRHKKKGGSSRNRSAALVQSGKLRRAVENSTDIVSWDKISFKVRDVAYAGVHNDGLHAGRGAGFTMPKRQFMGDSVGLRKVQLEKINQFVDKIW